jgi:hypothetical protein
MFGENMRDLLTKIDDIIFESTTLEHTVDTESRDNPAVSQPSRSDDNIETFRIGDDFGISISEEFEIGTSIVDILEDGIVVMLDDFAMDYLQKHGLIFKDTIELEAKYQGREVPLNKPMQGDVKKSKVYVKGPKGNVVKVNFGDKKMKIKKSNPARRKSFRARHNCENPGPKWKARYWSCRAW